MRLLVLAMLVVFTGCTNIPLQTRPKVPATGQPLKTVAELGALPDATAKSKAAFAEASKVLTHARCVNCHPPDDSPRQRELHEPHDPPVARGLGGFGSPNMYCPTCHQLENVEGTQLPGAPNWHLAPIEMAWLGKTPAQICNQLKDPARNGGKSLEKIVDHVTNDKLVGWGWAPGGEREPAPGTQKVFGELMAAWAENGAVCEEESR
ncbi:MAG: Isoquinoline 1-oxidoreductase subunit [Myxococcaceae bacterium]|nr:Isoquinoline 1-oxidoreductase subunit [Myxococcaceae bacterium]